MALALMAVAPAAVAQPAPPDSAAVAACRAACELLLCVEEPPRPAIGLDSLGALTAAAPYPAAARGTGAEGQVIVTFVVDENGRAGAFEVARGVSPALDSAAVRIVRSLAFAPARRPCWGEAVPLRYALPLLFRHPD